MNKLNCTVGIDYVQIEEYIIEDKVFDELIRAYLNFRDKRCNARIPVEYGDLDDIVDGGCPPGYNGCGDDGKQCKCKECWQEYLVSKAYTGRVNKNG